MRRITYSILYDAPEWFRTEEYSSKYIWNYTKYDYVEGWNNFYLIRYFIIHIKTRYFSITNKNVINHTIKMGSYSIICWKWLASNILQQDFWQKYNCVVMPRISASFANTLKYIQQDKYLPLYFVCFLGWEKISIEIIFDVRVCLWVQDP